MLTFRNASHFFDGNYLFINKLCFLQKIAKFVKMHVFIDFKKKFCSFAWFWRRAANAAECKTTAWASLGRIGFPDGVTDMNLVLEPACLVRLGGWAGRVAGCRVL